MFFMGGNPLLIPPIRYQTKNIDLDLACLIYTSGSTGEPKGVMSDHSNIIFAVNSITSYIGNTEDDVVINVLPLSFDYGLYQLFMVFSFGGRLILEKGFSYPAQILALIEKEELRDSRVYQLYLQCWLTWIYRITIYPVFVI